MPGSTPNNSFKPNLLRYAKAMAEKACHGFGSTTQVGLIQALGPMKSRCSAQVASVALLFAAVAISAGIVASGIEAGHSRNGLIVLNCFVWLLFVVFYPIGVIQSGLVTGTQPTSRSHRERAPARFWVGLFAMIGFWLAIVAFICLYSYMAWYRGA